MFLFHNLFVISPSQCTSKGSAERSTHTILVEPAGLSTQLPFSQFTCFLYIHTFFSLNMSEYVSFCFMFHVPHLIARLIRAIHQHIFSRLAGTQYTDCITCLANTHFVLVCTNYPNFTSLHIFLHLNMVCVCIIPNVLHLSIPACPHRPSRATMDCHPKGSAPLS